MTFSLRQHEAIFNSLCSCFSWKISNESFLKSGKLLFLYPVWRNSVKCMYFKGIFGIKFDRSFDILWLALCCFSTMCWSGYHRKRTKTLSTYVWIPCIDSSKWDIWRNNQISGGTIYSYSLVWMNWMQFFCDFNSLIYWSFILLKFTGLTIGNICLRFIKFL